MPIKMNKKDCIIRNEQKFTPGPWKKIRSSDLWYEILEEDNTLIADVLGEPNSALIAAAPEMFELLDEVDGILADISSWRPKRRAVENYVDKWAKLKERILEVKSEH